MAVWSAMAGEMAVWDVRGGPTLDEVGSQSPSSNGEEVSSTAAAEAAAAEEWPRSVSRASTCLRPLLLHVPEPDEDCSDGDHGDRDGRWLVLLELDPGEQSQV